MSYTYGRSAAAGLAAAALLGGCGSSATQRSATPTPAASTTTIAAATTAAETTAAETTTAPRSHADGRRAAAHRARHRPPPPGSLPQTRRLPSAHTVEFRLQVDALWRGIRTGSVRQALPAFFPEDAYAQVKAIAYPRADFVGRLLAGYRLDIAAAHALLGAHPRRARLVRVEVPVGYVHWVPPGSCYNRVGYYEVPNSRLVYKGDGQVRSFGIASMISWRGVWYVVHLGAVKRTGAGGVVDDPSTGAGTPTPSSTC